LGSLLQISVLGTDVNIPKGSIKRYSQHNRTAVNADATEGLGEIQILHPPGTFAVTPASRIAIQAIGKYQHLITGNGIDWGSGTGCLAITAARIDKVKRVIGLEISPLDVEVARQNAILNGVEDKAAFFLSDSFKPFAATGRKSLETLLGQTNFILANPPSSEGDDGFEYRQLVLNGARQYLVPGGVVFLSISYQYGQQRVERLSQQMPGFSYGGLLASTDWVSFDLQRPDLLHCLELYAEEERRGGLKYVFVNPEVPNVYLDAQAALAYFRRIGLSPLTKWQTHLFRYGGEFGAWANAKHALTSFQTCPDIF
jgi:SAM-dependent methyltransferase